MVSETMAVSGLLEADTFVEEEADYATAVLASSGFTDNGSTITDYISGTTYYKGTYTLYGVTVDCYKYKSGDYSTTERDRVDAEYAKLHPSWTKVYSASTKYNCHSYAWIDASQLNIYWLDNPDAFANSSSGTNSLSINTTSKLGRYGVYDAPLIDMLILYTRDDWGSSYYEVYR